MNKIRKAIIPTAGLGTQLEANGIDGEYDRAASFREGMKIV